MNIGALPTMVGMKQISASNPQKGGTATSKFGAVFAGISTRDVEPKRSVDGELPIELIPNVFNASTMEELEKAIQAIPGSDNIELSTSVEALGNKGDLEDFAKLLSINPESILDRLKQLLEKAGMTKAETEELTMASDMWSLLNMIDEAGIRFFDHLNEALQNPASRNEATQLLSILKAVDLLTSKVDMVISMEQKADSFRNMLTSAAGQFEQGILAIGKQEQLPFIQQKTDFRIVLETNSGTSTNAESSGQKHADTTSHASSAHVAATTVRGEVPVQQAESNQTNRSESLLKEMQALMKRANFGQVGGSNRMLIKLYPEHLGQIRIELLETNGIMTARILASTAFAKGLLDSQLHQLKHAFNQQNLQVDRIDVAQTLQESHRNEREQSFNEQFKREQQSDDNKQNKSTDEEQSFDEYMIELEV
ncbi:flagellar hook-length control protein FliK [Sporosarcina sp. Marseille-Q4943]|uniref:flagellar hook-length control protein FliK n=1 Tax=Sporosarcina sp. Marseille-Q4943 TaxID=2942204 RepID=UPI00208DA8D4|nr:flagellar hook-length control protein FliK [Sporosarcina sp. Marseille-Q4943]